VSARSKARKQTLDLLYESDIRSSDLLELLSSRDVEEEGPEARPIREYTKSLIEGIHTHKRKIDELITTYAQGWPVIFTACSDELPRLNRVSLSSFSLVRSFGLRPMPDSSHS
jgi:N utilization substance protein B